MKQTEKPLYLPLNVRVHEFSVPLFFLLSFTVDVG